ncbi:MULTISPECIES: CvpA family protein [Mediterraneibacter]|jgi:uncharacterized membrane protein required for colicin V production|uniref:CvpA family protein n=1 Tax=Mediterraneibacter TaxID=2316020 RepID=UPI00073EDADC|nr:CvpA family protein [Mediterraneibacter massiliensis]RGT73775.1 CvpA family protein [Ruminococcus sp. AF18-22]
MDNWLLIIVGVIFLVSIVAGYIRGALKIGLSLISTILTIVIVIFLSPYVADVLQKYTPADEILEEKVVEAFMPEISAEQLSDMELSGTPLEGLQSDEIQKLNELDWDMLGITPQDILGVIGEIPKDVQIQEIEKAPIPQFLKNALIENNNAAIYEELGVDTFPEYAAAYISRLAMRIVSFLVTFILAIIIVKALMVAVHIIGELPVIGFFNHLGGAVLGIFIALVIVWLGFLVITVCYSTAAGAACFEMIEKSPILTFLYEKNILLSKLLSF